MNPSLWPLALTLLALPRSLAAHRALSMTSDDIDDVRQKSLKRPYPLFSIRLHARFAAMATIGLAVAGAFRLLRLG